MKKGFILGFLCAAILFTAIGAGAYTLVPSTTKLVLDGVEMKDNAIPILYMEPGYNLIPAALFRKICSEIGIGFNYIDDTDTIEINTQVATSEPVAQMQEVNSMSEGTEKITQTPDGLPVYQYSEANYIDWIELRKKCESLGLKFKIEDNTFYFLNIDGSLICSLLLTTTYDPYDSAKYDDYISIALPLLQ